MKQDKYFKEELAFLKDQGKQFTEIYPQLSRFLHGRNTDPDVERLLEGFAFLTAKLREKVDDEFPELTHSIIQMLWPNYLRPIPSMSIVRFTPDKSVSEKQTIKQGCALDSIPVFDTNCRFTTCRDVDVFPVALTSVDSFHTQDASVVSLTLQGDSAFVPEFLLLDKLRFYIGGNKFDAQTLYLWLSHYLDGITIQTNDGEHKLPKNCLRLLGFEQSDSLLPYPKNVYDGYRIIQEYLAFPESFLFVEVNDLLKALPKKPIDSFTIEFSFAKTLPNEIRVNKEHFQLYCTPVINLFKHDADPIDLTGKKSEYRIVPSSRYPSHYEVFSIEAMTGWQDNSQLGERIRGQKRVYSPFESFEHEVERSKHRTALYYRTRVKESIRGDGLESYVSFVRGDESLAWQIDEAVSVNLLCTNRLLPSELSAGDICVATDTSPTFASFENLDEPTQSLRPNLDGSLLWTLISNLSLNYLSILSKEALSSVLRAYDFRALVDRQAEQVAKLRDNAIVSIESTPVDRILKGRPIRGIQSTLVLDQSGFATEGELYLFSAVLSRFFALYANINSFHELVVINATNKEKYQWGQQSGMQPMM